MATMFHTLGPRTSFECFLGLRPALTASKQLVRLAYHLTSDWPHIVHWTGRKDLGLAEEDVEEERRARPKKMRLRDIGWPVSSDHTEIGICR
jgi:hypothetical protein